MIKNTKFKNNMTSPEFLFVIYFWGSAFLRPILQYYNNYSSLILMGYSTLILVVSVFKNLIKHNINIKPLLIPSIVIYYFLIDILIRPNGYIITYLYDFIICGVIPIFLLIQIKKPDKLLKIYSICSAILFLFYFLEPFNGYQIFKQDMSFGFELAVPAYIGIYIGRKILKYRIYILLEIICFIEIIFFCNRSSLLTLVFFLMIMQFIYFKKNLAFKILIISILVFISVKFLPNFILWIYPKIIDKGLDSYSFRQFYMFIEKQNWETMFSGRFYIWNSAIDMVKNNTILGNGIGTFNEIYQTYTHNIFLDLMVQVGVIGTLPIILLIINSLYRTIKQSNYVKLLGIVFLTLWFPKLFFSIYLFKDKAIWCFLAYGFLNFRKSKCSISQMVKVRDNSIKRGLQYEK